jgi:ribonuclease Y
MDHVWILAVNIGILVVVAGLGYLVVLGRVRSVREEAESALDAARREADRLVREAETLAREQAAQRQRQADRDLQRRRVELERMENRLRARERTLATKTDGVERREKALESGEKDLQVHLAQLDRRESDLARRETENRVAMERLAGMTNDDARIHMMNRLEAELRIEMATTLRRSEAEAREKAVRQAREIITLAIQRSAAETATETTCTVVVLPNEESKGRIIGREGRNIRAFEAATGVNIVVDETPEAVVLSAFDPLRREVARISLEALLEDGRIHPARIEEVVRRVERDLDERLQSEGERAAYDLELHDLHPELIRLMGRLRFRTSYGQNVLAHSSEVGWLCGLMAAELGLDVIHARRAGFLHDIGKGAAQDLGGSHALVGADLCRKYGETSQVVNAVASHHNEEEPRTAMAVLVQAADTLSASRPGARRESIENYVRRLTRLEEIASSMEGVERVYAMQAGRELRVMVEPSRVSDAEAALLARDIGRRIEQEVEYPGQIRITVLRETRVTEVAGASRARSREREVVSLATGVD